LRPESEIAAGCVEVLGIRIDGICTINDRKPNMTNKKHVTRKNAPGHQSTKLDVATPYVTADHATSGLVGIGADSSALQPLAEMLLKLSPFNLHLVESIIRAIVEEQTRDRD
jgi:hypothetical protein